LLLGFLVGLIEKLTVLRLVGIELAQKDAIV
jgi:hypothetical protein